MPLFPDEELENFVRDAAGFPDVESPDVSAHIQTGRVGQPQLVKMLVAGLAKNWIEQRRKNGTKENIQTNGKGQA